MRTFVDEQGTEWTAWEVRPGTGSLARPERRLHDRRREAAPDPVVERRRGEDRRSRSPRARASLVPRTAAWLAFQAGTVRRRLVPIPDAWEGLTDVELRALCRAAAPVARAMVAVD
ncbi:hypothetical protein [Roseisolibacter agri]|uniref:Uncharacterized protein n=1 Tax=Roseisolibacter agri TaxID=2014610 RepID=A0AA37Q4Z2_9BACT|nr:hypothetical protein [Roseisolibacter agri]GLC26424.1 hypothetical protein rosag_29370 [Roseisolibacter agri]